MKKMSKEEAEEGMTEAYRQISTEEAFRSRTEYFKEVYKKLV
jgi:hypothetical protein